jgi:hypothetical protein
MSARIGFVLLAACAALAMSSSATAGAQRSGQPCMPVSVENRLGTFTYTVAVEAGAVRCGIARSVVRDVADWPPDAAAAGWRCTVGQGQDSWAISCTRAKAIVRAYGPTREHNPWVIARVQLRIGLLVPTSTSGLVLRQIRRRPCGAAKKWLEADYSRLDGATLTVAEGKPDVCANLGVAPRLAVWRIHGIPASLIEFCAPTGCARLWGDYALDWRERGIQITLLTHGLSQRQLLTIARSMTVVPA